MALCHSVAVTALAADFLLDVDLVLLAPFLSRDDLAVFGVCARLAGLLGFVLVAIYAVAMPAILEAGARRDEAAFRRQVGDANLLAAAAAALAALAASLSGRCWRWCSAKASPPARCR